MKPSKTKTITIGITGQIGSGKSTAARILAGYGGVIIDADQIGREVVESNPKLLKQLAAAFSSDILTPSGRLRRKVLASRAFTDNASRDTLNLLVHPHLLKELRRQLKELSKTNRMVIVDAALLLNWDLDRELDLTLVIHSGIKARLKRLAQRGIDSKDALARQKQRLPYAVYRSRADCLILNNKSLESLENKLKIFFDKFVQNRLVSG